MILLYDNIVILEAKKEIKQVKQQVLFTFLFVDFFLLHFNVINVQRIHIIKIYHAFSVCLLIMYLFCIFSVRI